MEVPEQEVSSSEEEPEEASRESEELIIPSTAASSEKPLFAEPVDLDPCPPEEEQAAEPQAAGPLDRFPTDAILVLQLLQVNDREYFAKIREEKNAIEDAKDEYNELVEVVLNLNAGLSGFVRKAILGSKVPPNYARLLEAMAARIALREDRLEFLGSSLAEARRLAEEAESTPDPHNTTINRQRALLTLEQEPEKKPLEEANRRVEMFKKLLRETQSELEEQLAEEKAENEAPKARRSLGELSEHFEAFKAEKSQEVKQKVLNSDVGKRGLGRLEELADRLDKKRKEKNDKLFANYNS